MEEKNLTHFDEKGNARMVDVSKKEITTRTALAQGSIYVSREIMEAVCSKSVKKGDVLTVAQIAGIMGAKRTAELIPMCHPVFLDGVDLELSLDEHRCCVEIRASVVCSGKTGVEMEALTAVSAAALTIYDMCKAVQRDIVIQEIRLLEKTGGVRGNYIRKEETQWETQPQ